ncbi:MAG: DUF4430 domain-containing protein [Ruminococcus sp.]|nr:DUF4430 domain-containing protein [Ruminococcus sp.]
MKCKSMRFVCAIMTAILVFVSGIAVTAYTAEYDTSEIGQNIIEYKMNSEGYSDKQAFIDGWLTENAGTGSAEWYALCLAREGSWDFSSYEAAIESCITEEGLRATDYQRMAIAYNAVGGADIDIGAVIDSTYNELGIMSEIYGLILLNSGDFSCSADESEIVEALLARQNEQGGWALSGSVSDPDVTSMAIQALSAYRSNPTVQSSIDTALKLLSSMQQSDGGFKSYGTSNSESCAQVIIALCQLGIDPQGDTDFIKNGNSILDALMTYQCESGGFSHISGGGENGIATYQAYEAMTAVTYSGLYLLDEKTIELNESEASDENDISEANQNQTASSASGGGGTSSSSSGSGLGSGSNEKSSNNSNTSSVTESENSTHTAESENQTENADNSSSVGTESKITSVTEAASVTESASSETVTSASSAALSSAGSTESTGEESVTESTTAAAVVLTSGNADGGGTGSAIGWKIIAYAVIFGLFAASQIYLLARKQFSWKRLASAGAVCLAAGAAVFFINIQSPEDYYGGELGDIQSDSLTVTISVSCETIKDEIDGEYMIIPETEVVLLEDDTAFDVLERVLAYYEIPFDYSGNTRTDYYVRGINNIYEMDYGEMSGWMYRVNGEFPNVGCGAYTLTDGDDIEFLYTQNIGRDIGMEEYSE